MGCDGRDWSLKTKITIDADLVKMHIAFPNLVNQPLQAELHIP